MASFVPEVPYVNTPDDLYYSRGQGRSTMFQSLFGGLADTIGGYTKARDEQIQNQIYEDVRHETDVLQQPLINSLDQDTFGTVTADQSGNASGGQPSGEANGQGSSPVDVPDGLNRQFDRLGTLQAGMANGNYRQFYYENQLNAMVKAMRAQYPGYDQQIDEAVRSVTGMHPANELVTGLFQQDAANAAQLRQEQDKRTTWVNQNEAEIVQSGHGDYFQNPDKYNDPSAWGQMQYDVAKTKANTANLDLADKQAGLAAKGVAADKDNYINTYTTTAGAKGKMIIDSVMNSNPDLAKNLQAWAADPNSADPKTIEQIEAAAPQIMAAANKQADSYLDDPYLAPDGTYHTRRADMGNDPNAIQGVKSAFTHGAQEILDQIHNKDYGLASFSANYAQQSIDQAKANILKNSPEAREVATVRGLYGDQLVSQSVATGSPFADTYHETLRQLGNIGIISGQGSADQWTKELKSDPNDPKGTTASSVVQNNVQSAIKMITDPSTDDNIRAKALNWLYGADNQNFLLNFNGQDRTTMFSRMVNPDVAQKVYDLSQKGNPQLWQEYKEWAVSNFTGLFINDASSIQTGVVNRKFLQLGWNGNTGQITTNVDRRGMSNSMQGPPEQILTPVATSAVGRVNQQLSSIAKVFQLDGRDPNQEVLKLLHGMGVDFSAPKEGSALDQLGRAIISGLKVNPPSQWGLPTSGPAAAGSH